MLNKYNVKTNKDKTRYVVFKALAELGWHYVGFGDTCVMRKGTAIFVVDYIQPKESDTKLSFSNKDCFVNTLVMHHLDGYHWHIECNGFVYDFGKFSNNLSLLFDSESGLGSIRKQLDEFVKHIDKFSRMSKSQLLMQKVKQDVSVTNGIGIIASETDEEPTETGYFKVKTPVLKRFMPNTVYTVSSYSEEGFYCKQMNDDLTNPFGRELLFPMDLFINKFTEHNLIAVRLQHGNTERKSINWIKPNTEFSPNLDEFDDFNLSSRQLMILGTALQNGINFIPYLENYRTEDEMKLILEINTHRPFDIYFLIGKRFSVEQLTELNRIASNGVSIKDFSYEFYQPEQIEMMFNDRMLMATTLAQELYSDGYSNSVIECVQALAVGDGQFDRDSLSKYSSTIAISRDIKYDSSELLHHTKENGVVSESVILYPVNSLTNELKILLRKILSIGDINVGSVPLNEIVDSILAGASNVCYRVGFGLYVSYKGYIFKAQGDTLCIFDSALTLLWQASKINNKFYFNRTREHLLNFRG